MKVLIMSCNNGGGHNAVSKAIKEMFEIENHKVDIVDALSFISPEMSKMMSKSHSAVYRNAPQIFDVIYGIGEKNRESFQSGNLADLVMSINSKSVYEYIRDNEYDVVISAISIVAPMINKVIKKYDLDIITAGVETDYTASPGNEAGRFDFHFVPSQMQKVQLIRLGVPKRRIIVSGIPVKLKIYEQGDKVSCKKQIGIKDSDKHILMVGGSMGCGPTDEILEMITPELDESVHVSVVCGTNEKKQNELSELYKDYKNVHILGYVNNMEVLYKASDLVITKPGGISTTEALRSHLPMVLINSVGGCERHNLEFFLNTGGAVSYEDTRSLADVIVDTIYDDEKLENMSLNLKMLSDKSDQFIITKAISERYSLRNGNK